MAASTVLLALSWASLRIRSQQVRINQLETAEKPPAGENRKALARLESQVATETSQRKRAEESAAARETELQGIITFLRKELNSANDAIDRLKAEAAAQP